MISFAEEIYDRGEPGWQCPGSTHGHMNRGKARKNVLTLPAMPPIGRSETYYANHAHRAHKAYDLTARDAFKVGHYITLGLNQNLQWADQLHYFRHALDHHCIPPPYAKDDMKAFYNGLTQYVRRYCGEEALRRMSDEDDKYARRLNLTSNRELIFDEASTFFRRFIETCDCPDWFNPEDYETMKFIRNQWV